MKETKRKRFILAPLWLKMEAKSKHPCGLILKRDLSLGECRHVVEDLIGVECFTRDSFYDEEEYRDYTTGLTIAVNRWLRGEESFSNIKEINGYGFEEISVFRIFAVVEYLQRKRVI